MFLLVSVRHVGTHPDGHQHGVSIEIFKFGQNISSDISNTKYSSDLNLGESICILTSFHFPDLIFILIYFEWRDTENTGNMDLQCLLY